MPLKVVSRHGSPYLYLRGTVRGIAVDESTGTADRKAADQIRIKREAEILERSIHGVRATATFLMAAVSYLEADGDPKYLGRIIDHFGDARLTLIDQDVIDNGARKLYPNAGPATRNRQFYTPVSAVLHHAARNKWCEVPTIRRPSQPPARVRWITPDEAERLIDACAPHLRRIVIFGLYTGARVSEMLNLDWHDLDLFRRHVTFLDTKNGTSRGVPLHKRVVAELAGINNRDGCVFTRPDGQPYADKEGDGGGEFKTAWKGACKRAGITDFRPHDMRHTWATWTYQRTPDLTKLMVLGGWKTMAMVARYAHTDSSTHQTAIDALPWGNSGDGDTKNGNMQGKSA